MLVWLFTRLDGMVPGVDVLRYLSVRIALAAITSFLVTLVLIPAVCRFAAARGFQDRADKSDSGRLNDLHAGKRKTPILGGVAIIASALLSLLFWGHLTSNFYVALAAVTILSLSLCGFVDDWTKTFGANRTQGLSARQKLCWQTATALVAALLLLEFHGQEALLPQAFGADHRAVYECSHELAAPLLSTAPEACLCDADARLPRVEMSTIYPPFFKDLSIPLGGVLFVVFVLLVVVGSSNAVNLTDGLDGLAGGCSIFACLVYTILAYVSGRSDFSAYLGIPYVPGVGELSVLCAALSGGCAGFLWYNCHPATIFMGDTGSLPLGGSLGLVAVITKHDLLLVLVGGVFVAEALSVMAQVLCFKLTGRRILRCAPLHHHFEFSGWRETKVVQRFWIVAAFLALAALVTLKLR